MKTSPAALLSRATLILVASAAIAVTACGGSSDKAVPNVIGQSVAAATTILVDDGFKVDVKRVSDAKAKDWVLSEDPGAGQKAKQGSTVTITVSDGPGEGKVPDVARLGRDEAEQVIREAGFVPQITEVFSAAVASGLAVATTPPAGTDKLKGSDVTLEISRGPQQVTVPDVTGDQEETAVADLKALGFAVEITGKDGNETPNSVIGQTPAPKTEAQVGSTVRIVVDRAPTQVTVPGVVGDTQQAAANAISEGGLSSYFVTQQVTNPAQDGIVLSESPASGTKVAEGSRVTLTIGKSPTPPPVPPVPPIPPGPVAPIIRTFGVNPFTTHAYAVPITSGCNLPKGEAVLQAVVSDATVTGATIVKQGRAKQDGHDVYYATVRSGDISPGSIRLRITIACSV